MHNPFTQRNDLGQTFLHLAAEQGDLKRVHDLLEQGYDIDATCHQGLTPLMWAVVGGHMDVAHLLLDRGASVRCTPIARQQVLHLAVPWQDSALVRRLLEKGALSHVMNDEEIDPLMMAYRQGHVPTLSTFFDQGCTLDDEHWQDIAMFSGDKFESFSVDTWLLILHRLHPPEQRLLQHAMRQWSIDSLSIDLHPLPTGLEPYRKDYIVDTLGFLEPFEPLQEALALMARTPALEEAWTSNPDVTSKPTPSPRF
jgi:hypothetical protein